MPSTKAIKNQNPEFARVIECNTISTGAAFHWLALAIKDLIRAPLISLIYGLVFTLIPATILYLVAVTQNHLIILPCTVAFALIGPMFATGLYDVAWELEKGHKPTLKHSIRSMFRNPVNEWGFAIMLMVLMIAWMRIAALLYALYPNEIEPSLEELLTFLGLGTFVGSILLTVVFSLTVFTPQIMVERKVDIMTAVRSSLNAVTYNMSAMLLWAILIIIGVTLGFATLTVGFIIIMPILSFASWHAYIAVIKTKKPREYE